MGDSHLFDALKIHGPDLEYELSTCSGKGELRKGRRSNRVIIESHDGKKKKSLPVLLENDNIPSDKNEIPTPDICKAFKHLKPIIDYIPEPKKNVGIHLLMTETKGRNSSNLGWDETLPEKYLPRWTRWCNNLNYITKIQLQRCYTPSTFGPIKKTECHIFSDASNEAIGAVAYMRLINHEDNVNVSFILGKAKVNPTHAVSIPRLELGDENPADIASRSVPAQKLNSTIWLSGPAFLWQRDEQDNHEATEHKYTVSDEDPEVRKQLAVLNTSTKEVEQDNLGAHRFQRFSSWRSLKRSIANLIGKIRQRKSPEKTDKKENDKSPEELKIEMMAQAETIILRSVQKSVFHKEYEILSAAKSAGTDNKLQKLNPISRMNPFIDEKGLIRVGGRLRQSDLDLCGRHPIILPQDNHISRLIIDHVHRQVQHQGRQLTLSNVRANGYWIMGVHDMNRENPPFTNVGMDVFGPWAIASRKTRAGTSEAKRWAVIFVCLYTTAVHIEVIDSMDTSAFINALRRFIAIRGNIKKLRCDQGTNFIGAKNELRAAAKEPDQDRIKKLLTTELERDCKQQYTHDLLTTLMAEASAIVNSRPITTVSSDANDPQALTPNMLLTMKTQSPTPPPGSFVLQDIYSRKRWRRVQYLADQFWIRWMRKEYLESCQPRPKWNKSTINVKEGDMVLLREKEYARNSWPSLA
ncbi:uncharacterized protein [Ptychodera flava]|uniref:uncharacterized protein n=1 Tax=Ptychodera flava TaxID=63121 RepID=UPI00396A29EA